MIRTTMSNIKPALCPIIEAIFQHNTILFLRVTSSYQYRPAYRSLERDIGAMASESTGSMSYQALCDSILPLAWPLNCKKQCGCSTEQELVYFKREGEETLAMCMECFSPLEDADKAGYVKDPVFGAFLRKINAPEAQADDLANLVGQSPQDLARKNQKLFLAFQDINQCDSCRLDGVARNQASPHCCNLEGTSLTLRNHSKDTEEMKDMFGNKLYFPSSSWENVLQWLTAGESTLSRLKDGGDISLECLLVDLKESPSSTFLKQAVELFKSSDKSRKVCFQFPNAEKSDLSPVVIAKKPTTKERKQGIKGIAYTHTKCRMDNVIPTRTPGLFTASSVQDATEPFSVMWCSEFTSLRCFTSSIEMIAVNFLVDMGLRENLLKGVFSRTEHLSVDNKWYGRLVDSRHAGLPIMSKHSHYKAFIDYFVDVKGADWREKQLKALNNNTTPYLTLPDVFHAFKSSKKPQ